MIGDGSKDRLILIGVVSNVANPARCPRGIVDVGAPGGFFPSNFLLLQPRLSELQMTDNSSSNPFRPLLPRPLLHTSTFASSAQASTLVPKRSAVKAACEACRRRKAKVYGLFTT
jgi:hypothetical protein